MQSRKKANTQTCFKLLLLRQAYQLLASAFEILGKQPETYGITD